MQSAATVLWLSHRWRRRLFLKNDSWAETCQAKVHQRMNDNGGGGVRTKRQKKRGSTGCVSGWTERHRRHQAERMVETASKLNGNSDRVRKAGDRAAALMKFSEWRRGTCDSRGQAATLWPRARQHWRCLSERQGDEKEIEKGWGCSVGRREKQKWRGRSQTAGLVEGEGPRSVGQFG